ncbi:MAG: hypothetical protein LBB63_04290, partial [Holosporaceae bacterium]|nr:hypothetical protein [Holosporaceae bacterium]
MNSIPWNDVLMKNILTKARMFFQKRTFYVILLILLGCAATIIMWNAAWLPGDDVQLIRTTVIGKWANAYQTNGRLWPLGLSDYNLLLFIPNNGAAKAYFLLHVVELITATLILYAFLNKITENRYVVSLAGILVLYSSRGFWLIHLETCYAERSLIL